MSVPPLFKFSKDSFFSIGLPVAQNTFFQLSEEELKKQISSSKKNQNENSLPEFLFVKENNKKNIFNSSESAHTIEEKDFDVYYQNMIKHLDDKLIWIRNSYLILSNKSALKIRNISEYPQDDLFILKKFSMPAKEELENFEPDWYFINTPEFSANFKAEGINDTKFCIINSIKKVVLIGGTSYSEELIQPLFFELELALNIKGDK